MTWFLKAKWSLKKSLCVVRGMGNLQIVNDAEKKSAQQWMVDALKYQEYKTDTLHSTPSTDWHIYELLLL